MDLGQVVYRDKTTIDQQSWSEPISPWKTGVSGLRPEDLVQKMSEVIKPEQLSIIKKTLEAASFRLGNGHHQQCVDADYARICTPVNGGAPIHWSLILITMSHFFVGLTKGDLSKNQSKKRNEKTPPRSPMSIQKRMSLKYLNSHRCRILG